MSHRHDMTTTPPRMAGHAPAPAISLRGVTKQFSNALANDSVDLDLFPGEVHALLGENGAGKSTLMKILYGFYNADSGSIAVDGKEVHIKSPMDARRYGIGMVFQAFTLIPAMTVAENIALYMPNLPVRLDIKRVAERIHQLGQQYRLNIDPGALVRDIAIGDQQKVEVLKLLVADARVLIFDEATRVLAPHEIEGLFEVFKKLKEDGYVIVFITHKMREVIACADRITVMRKGRIAGQVSRSEATEQALVSLMFGEAAPAEVYSRPLSAKAAGAPRLKLQGVSTHSVGMQLGLSDIELVIHPGEIIGVAGVSGNGQRELGDVILGLLPCAKGKRTLDGVDATSWPAGRIRAHGVGYIPDDPLGLATVPWMTVAQNTALGNTERYARYGGLALDWRGVEADLAKSFSALSLAPLKSYIPVSKLSGGQLQRAVLARELGRSPNLLIALYPTRGLDVFSAMSARRVISELRNHGGGVLLISEDLDELFMLSDRLVVLFEGRIVGMFPPHEVSREQLGFMMTGSGEARE